MIPARPRLLVSVFAPDEVEAAVAGGADIVDVKDPGAGALGAPRAGVLRAVARAVAGRAPLSVALGDEPPPNGRPGAAAVACGAVYVKVGLLGASRPEEAIARLAALRATVDPARLVAVAFADAAVVGGLPASALPLVARAAGADVAMLDTAHKDGRSAFDHLGTAGIAAFVAQARGLGLGVALAGALRAEDVDRAAELGVGIVGVRGAACDGGRLGRVSAERVRMLRSSLTRSGSRNGGWATDIDASPRSRPRAARDGVR